MTFQKKIFFVPLAFFFVISPLHPKSPISFGGYAKSFFVAFNYSKAGAEMFSFPDRPMGMINNRLRLNVSFSISDALSFSVSYNISPRIQDPKLFEQSPVAASIDPFQYRAVDLDSRLYPPEREKPRSFGIFQNLDRAVLTIQTEPADIFIGRQAIAWGSARVINPTDIIAPFSFEELDIEDRIGVDAVRVRFPLGLMSEMDAGYVFGKDFQWKKSAFFLRGKFYLAKTDASVLLLGFQQNLLLGLDIARSIEGAGFWLEVAYVLEDAFAENKTGKSKNYCRASIGLDYSFSSKTYGFIEYHFSSAGRKSPEDYLQNFSSPAFSEGAVYLMGRHYLAPGLSCQLTPLVTVTALALWNLSDRSFFFAPQVEYNVSQNMYVSAGAFVGTGKSPDLNSRENLLPVPQFRSEFGGYPDIYFSSFRIYF